MNIIVKMGCVSFKKFKNQETVTGDRRVLIPNENLLIFGFKVSRTKHLFTINEVSASQEI